MENLNQSTSPWRWLKFHFLSMPARMKILVEWGKRERGGNNTDLMVMVSPGPAPISQPKSHSNVQKVGEGGQGKGSGKKEGINPFLGLF